VAKAEENLLLYSQEFNNSGWLKSAGVVSANSTAAPDGTTTAETFTANSGTVSPYIQPNFATAPLSANTQATHSIFVKKNTHDFVQVWVQNGGVNSYANFDINAGTLGNAGSGVTNHAITSVGNGWYRCSMTFTATSLSQGAGVAIVGSTTATRLQTFSAAGTESIYIWGAQLEQRSSVTAYTATTDQPITNYIPALQTAASGVARFEHNPVTGESLGLEIEEQRTNLALRSEEFDNASWTKSNATITANTVVAPDGALTGDKLVENTTNSAHEISQSVSFVSGTSYTFTVFAKAAERSFVRLAFPSNAFGAGVAAFFNLTTGAVATISAGTPTTSITPVGNGWFRCSIAKSATVSTSGSVTVLCPNADNTLTYLGDGYSGIYIWGAQLEAGSFATSYIPTVASQMTRSADSASMTGTNFSSWYRADEGTSFVSYRLAGLKNNARIFAFDDGTANNFHSLATVGGGSTLQYNISTTGSVTVGTAVAGADRLAGIGYSGSGISAYTESTSGTSTGVVTNRISQLSIFSLGGGFGNNGTIKKIAYYPKRLTNAELQGLTTV
jgi:hypothetical protein